MLNLRHFSFNDFQNMNDWIFRLSCFNDLFKFFILFIDFLWSYELFSILVVNFDILFWEILNFSLTFTHNIFSKLHVCLLSKSFMILLFRHLGNVFQLIMKLLLDNIRLTLITFSVIETSLVLGERCFGSMRCLCKCVSRDGVVVEVRMGVSSIVMGLSDEIISLRNVVFLLLVALELMFVIFRSSLVRSWHKI